MLLSYRIWHHIYWYICTDFSKTFTTSIFRLGQQNLMTRDSVLDCLSDRCRLSLNPSVNKSVTFFCPWKCAHMLSPSHDMSYDVIKLLYYGRYFCLVVVIYMGGQKNISRFNTPKVPPRCGDLTQAIFKNKDGIDF
jgi:hypothetical protein